MRPTRRAPANELLDLGPRSVVITLGSGGAAVSDATGSWLAPAHPVRGPVDTTGAGAVTRAGAR